MIEFRNVWDRFIETAGLTFSVTTASNVRAFEVPRSLGYEVLHNKNVAADVLPV